MGRSKEAATSNPISRSPSADFDQGSSSTDNDKQFSVTMFVNEHEKNKIVDMIHKAKSLITRKVEKVIGRRPRSEVTNVETLQTVLESWVQEEAKQAAKEEEEERQLIEEQGQQVSNMRARGQRPPVNYKPIPDLSVEDSDETDTITECSLISDMEVKCLSGSKDKTVRSPSLLYPRPSPSPSLTPTGENVPCPFRMRSENELYPPRLRRPSSHYGIEAAAASSRPPSRQCSMSPSFCSSPATIDHTDVIEEEEAARVEAPPERNAAQPPLAVLQVDGMSEEERKLQKEVEETFRQYIRFCRPDSYLVPIGGVWKPDQDREDHDAEYVKPTTDVNKDKSSRESLSSRQTSRAASEHLEEGLCVCESGASFPRYSCVINIHNNYFSTCLY